MREPNNASLERHEPLNIYQVRSSPSLQPFADEMKWCVAIEFDASIGEKAT